MIVTHWVQLPTNEEDQKDETRLLCDRHIKTHAMAGLGEFVSEMLEHRDKTGRYIRHALTDVVARIAERWSVIADILLWLVLLKNKKVVEIGTDGYVTLSTAYDGFESYEETVIEVVEYLSV